MTAEDFLKKMYKVTDSAVLHDVGAAFRAACCHLYSQENREYEEEEDRLFGELSPAANVIYAVILMMAEDSEEE